MADYPCPRCGSPTSGSYSPGGLRSVICADCMDSSQRAFRAQILEDIRELEASFDYPREDEE